MNQQTMTIWALVAATTLLAACGGSGGGEAGSELIAKRTPSAQLQLKAVSSCADWRGFAAESFVERALSPVYYYVDGGPVPVAAEGDATGGASAPDFTDTNTQEVGVDEADLIETDSARGIIYALHRETGSVRVIDAVPAAASHEVGRIDLGASAYLYGQYLDPVAQRLTTVVGDSVGTRLDFYDVSDAAQPAHLGQYRVDGYYLSSRRIGTRIHLIASHYFTGLDALYSSEAFNSGVNAWFEAEAAGDAERADEQRAELLALAQAEANNAPLAELVPNTATAVDAPLTPMDCAALYRPEVATAMATLTMTSIDMDGSNAAAIGAVNNAWIVYASADNLYLAQTSNGWFFAPFQVDQTLVHRFEISDSGPAVPKGAGVVDGWLLNRYAMSESGGHLRLATSRSDSCNSVNPNETCPAEASVPTNDVTVLRLDDNALTQVGHVTGFGNDERVFSARFVGDVGYVVTFRQTDPLFTFDLSDPTDPILLGEVEIPGFSSYIHPISDDVLLTIGREGGEGGVGTGNAFQLQLFDVSDLTNPTRIAAATPAIEPDDYAYSLAEYEPLAFTYAPATDTTGLLSIPAQIGSPAESRAFSGFITWDIDTAGVITEQLHVDHKQTGGGDACPPVADGSEGGCTSFAPVYYNAPLRSVIATDATSQTLYTLSDAFLIVTDAATGSELATLEFE